MKNSRVKGKNTRTVKPPARSSQASKKKTKGNIVLTTLAVGAAGILGYLGWQYYKKRKAAKLTAADYSTVLQPATAASVYPAASSVNTDSTAASSYIAPVATPAATSKTSAAAATTASSGFPLKKGSKGTLVKTLQQALIAKYGASILPKFGADGDFGAETAAALKTAGLPASIDDSTYYVIVQGSSGITDKPALAGKLLDAASAQNFTTALSLLKQMNTKEDYKQVSAVFSESRLRGVRQTLVNGMLSSFGSDSQKQQIRYEFIRMGLKYDGAKWSLDGFDGRPVVTIEPTNVWINATQSMSVPAMMVLGAEVSRKLDYTLFENNSRYFLVATKSIKYL